MTARLRRFAAFGVALVACAGDPTTQTLTVTVDGNLTAGTTTCANLNVQLAESPPAGQALTVVTTLGILNPSGATDADKRQATLTTGTDKTLSVVLCPGPTFGSGVATVSATGVAPASTAVTVAAQTLKLSMDQAALNAGSTSCSTISLALGSEPASPATVTLTTTLGALFPSDPTKQLATLTTGPGGTATATLCPGTTPGNGVLVATSPGVDAQSIPFAVGAPSPVSVYLAATQHLLHAPGETTSTLDVTVFPPAGDAPPVGTRVAFSACCDPSAELPTKGFAVSCADYVAVPPFADTTASSASAVPANAQLTVDGETFTKPHADGAVHERAVRIFAYVPIPGAPGGDMCPALSAKPETVSSSIASVDIVLSTQDPDASVGAAGAAGAAGASAAGAGGAM